MGKSLIIKGGDFYDNAIIIESDTLEIPTIELNTETGSVELSTTEDYSIYYTLDGEEPTAASTLYSESFVPTYGDVIVEAKSVSGIYISVLPDILFILSDDNSELTLSSLSGGTILYTTDGTDPVSSSTEYTDVITVSEGTIKAAVFDDGDIISSIASIVISDE